MRTNVQTQNSVYVLDKENMTWERVVHKASSNKLKEQSGKLAVFPYIVPGLPLILVTKDEKKPGELGFLQTSLVVSFEEEKIEVQA